MRIDTIRIKNFRAIKDQTVRFTDYTCLLGANGAGKSTILNALNVFFRESANVVNNTTRLEREDFHGEDVSEPIEITVTFRDLNPDAREALSHYYRNEKLIVTAVAKFDPGINGADVEQFGERLVMEEFKAFFEKKKAGAGAVEQRQLYRALREAVPELPEHSTISAMESALREYEEAHPELCKPERSTEVFYGFTKGTNKLKPFIEWVYVPAVKDASTEQSEGRSSALGQILQRTVRNQISFDAEVDKIRDAALKAYAGLLDEQQKHLHDLSSRLTAKLEQWARPGVKVAVRWHQDSEKSVQIASPQARLDGGDEGFLGSISRLGHGLQRSYLIALLQELAESDESRRPTLVLAIEEPELYQHPPQARHLSEVLQRLSDRNAQVMITTHSPLFVPADALETVRLVRKSPQHRFSEVVSCSYSDLTEEVQKADQGVQKSTLLLQIRRVLNPVVAELFFAAKLVLVESEEDVAYVAAHMQANDHWVSFRQRGIHLLPVGRKSDLLRPLAVARKLSIPTFVIFDGDANQRKPEHLAMQKAENGRLLRLLGRPDVEPMPSSDTWGDDFVMWHTEIGDAVARDFSVDDWSAAGNEAGQKLGFPADASKNPMLVAARLHALHAAGRGSSTLEKLCSKILGL